MKRKFEEQIFIAQQTAIKEREMRIKTQEHMNKIKAIEKAKEDMTN